MNGKNERKVEIRSILAVVGGISGLWIIGYLALKGNDTALGALVGIVSGIFSFYFGTEVSRK